MASPMPGNLVMVKWSNWGEQLAKVVSSSYQTFAAGGALVGLKVLKWRANSRRWTKHAISIPASEFLRMATEQDVKARGA